MMCLKSILHYSRPTPRFKFRSIHRMNLGQLLQQQRNRLQTLNVPLQSRVPDSVCNHSVWYNAHFPRLIIDLSINRVQRHVMFEHRSMSSLHSSIPHRSQHSSNKAGTGVVAHEEEAPQQTKLIELFAVVVIIVEPYLLTSCHSKSLFTPYAHVNSQRLQWW